MECVTLRASLQLYSDSLMTEDLGIVLHSSHEHSL